MTDGFSFFSLPVEGCRHVEFALLFHLFKDRKCAKWFGALTTRASSSSARGRVRTSSHHTTPRATTAQIALHTATAKIVPHTTANLN